jgi:uncharacterized protein YcfL
VKRVLSIVVMSLLLSGCSSSNVISMSSTNSVPLREDVTSEDYVAFQDRLNNSLDSAIYSAQSTLVSIENDSNFDENDSLTHTLYFKDNENKYKIQLPLSSYGTESESVRGYYSSCSTISELVIVEPFQAATVNSYTATKFYLLEDELWQIVIDDKVGAIFQYFKLDDKGRIVEQVNILRAVAKTTDENIDETESNFTDWSFEKLKDFINTSSEKTVSKYTYDNYNSLNTPLSTSKWLEIALKGSKTAPQPIFMTSKGEFITNVSSSSDGLTCLLK